MNCSVIKTDEMPLNQQSHPVRVWKARFLGDTLSRANVATTLCTHKSHYQASSIVVSVRLVRAGLIQKNGEAWHQCLIWLWLSRACARGMGTSSMAHSTRSWSLTCDRHVRSVAFTMSLFRLHSCVCLPYSGYVSTRWRLQQSET